MLFVCYQFSLNSTLATLTCLEIGSLPNQVNEIQKSNIDDLPPRCISYDWQLVFQPVFQPDMVAFGIVKDCPPPIGHPKIDSSISEEECLSKSALYFCSRTKELSIS